MRRIANRKTEFEAFTKLLNSDATKRILLIEGPSESGKSTLLEEFSTVATERLGERGHACADFNGGLLLPEFLACLLRELGDDVLPLFSKSIQKASASVDITADLTGAKLGDHNNVILKPALSVESGENPAAIREKCEAILLDFQKLQAPLVLIIDSFDKATDEAAGWILKNLLPVVRRNAHLRIVLGGKSLPVPSNFRVTWGRHAELRVLGPVISVDDWHAFALQLHPEFPRSHIETVCQGGLTDRPSVLHSFIEKIAKQLPPMKVMEARR